MTTREYFEAADSGNFPAGTTLKDLVDARTNTAWTALHVAAKNGHLLPGTTAEDLASIKTDNGYTALHIVAEMGPLPPGTTAKILSGTKTDCGWTALGLSACWGVLPTGTTAHDLLKVEGMIGKSTLSDLDRRQIRRILEDTSCKCFGEVREIADELREVEPVGTALWMVREIRKLKVQPD